MTRIITGGISANLNPRAQFNPEAARAGSVIRLIRSFRVVRLLSRFKALREIISALLESIIPVANAFTILLLIISVCECRPALFPSQPLLLVSVPSTAQRFPLGRPRSAS